MCQPRKEKNQQDKSRANSLPERMRENGPASVLRLNKVLAGVDCSKGCSSTVLLSIGEFKKSRHYQRESIIENSGRIDCQHQSQSLGMGTKSLLPDSRTPEFPPQGQAHFVVLAPPSA